MNLNRTNSTVTRAEATVTDGPMVEDYNGDLWRITYIQRDVTVRSDGSVETDITVRGDKLKKDGGEREVRSNQVLYTSEADKIGNDLLNGTWGWPVILPSQVDEVDWRV